VNREHRRRLGHATTQSRHYGAARCVHDGAVVLIAPARHVATFGIPELAEGVAYFLEHYGPNTPLQLCPRCLCFTVHGAPHPSSH